MEKVSCTIDGVRFRNPENSYSVLQVRVGNDDRPQTIYGTFDDIIPGSTILAEGEWKMNKWGRQFAVQSWTEVMPSTIRGIENYLGSGMISGIGKTMARRIVRFFGLDTFDVLDNHIESLRMVRGIGRYRVEKIRSSWERHKGVREVMVFLQGHGASAAYATKIFKAYGMESIQKVKENPYCLAKDITGIGFKMADTIASSLGYGKNDIRRLKSGILYTLEQLSNEGHCFMESKKLTVEARELLEAHEQPVAEALDYLVMEEDVIGDDDNIYLPRYYYAEVSVANKIKRLLKGPNDLWGKKLDIKAISRSTKIEYDSIQEDAIKEALKSKVMVLTGGPGTGKTTTTMGIITALETFKKRILLAAPTGRAAKRMSEATGKEAKTIHRLLEYRPGSGFGRNDEYPLSGDVLVVDEASMIDISLMNALLKAVPARMRLILVGDIDQLPSVGAGNVLRDIIDSGTVPVVRLTRIFRQALTSRIVTNAHRINRGEFPDVTNGKDSDFFFIKDENQVHVAEEIVNIVSNRIPKAYGYGIGDIQVLAPKINGDVGITNLNILLQKALNPKGESISSGPYNYRAGDKVMQTKNNYDKNVFNGDVGVIEKLDTDEMKMAVRYDDRLVHYEKDDLDEITLSYACTIHKSQGSEYPVVVMPLMTSHYIMLQRNLIYTGVTRAKKLCIVIGQTKAVGRAVTNMSVLRRNTRLKERLRDDIANIQLKRQLGLRAEDLPEFCIDDK